MLLNAMETSSYPSHLGEEALTADLDLILLNAAASWASGRLDRSIGLILLC